MATVEVTPAKVETKIVEIEPARVNIDLSLEEAAALHAILGKSVGSNALAKLYRSLSSEGVVVNRYRAEVMDGTGNKIKFGRVRIATRLADRNEEW